MLNKAKLKIFPWISTRQKGTNHHKPMLLFVCSVELKMYKTNQSQYLYAVVLKVYKHILYSILSINQPHDSKRWNCKSFVETPVVGLEGPTGEIETVDLGVLFPTRFRIMRYHDKIISI